MVRFEIIIEKEAGMHARPTRAIVTSASSFQCDIHLKRNKHVASAKSIMAVLGMGLSIGSTLEVICEGSDEKIAAEEMFIVFNKVNQGVYDLS